MNEPIGNRNAIPPALGQAEQVRHDRTLTLDVTQLGVGGGGRQPAVEKALAQVTQDGAPAGRAEAGGGRPA